MHRYVEIAVNVPQVSGVFDYHLPEELEEQVEIGSLVEAPFGQQHVQGVVLQFIDHPSVSETRAIIRLIEPQPVLTTLQIELAKHLAQTTLATLAAWVNLMLPPGLAQQSDTLYKLSGQLGNNQKFGPLQNRLLKLLNQRGALRGRQIDQFLPRLKWRSSARSLVQSGIVETISVLPESTVRPKQIRMVELACSPEQARLAFDHIGKKGSAVQHRRQAILEYLIKEITPTQPAWLYATSGGNASDLRRLSEMGLVRLVMTETWRDPLEKIEPYLCQPPALTHDQLALWMDIQNHLNQSADGHVTAPLLLHGVTGSGKTELYLRAVERVLQYGRQAIMLVPEIALTPQATRRILARFPGQVGLVHSRLSPGERYDTWRRAQLGELPVIVGPRSALFTPVPNPGLIVLDECHDDSYYQSEPPFYHTREVAIVYAQLAKAVCLFGSATPDLVSLYQAHQGNWKYLHLPRRILAHRQAVTIQAKQLGITPQYHALEADAVSIELPPVGIVDMRQELKSGNRSIFSRRLQSALQNALENHQQAILFLNRRGTATYIFCRDCGAALKCPNCDIPYTLHAQAPGKVTKINTASEQHRNILLCHHCGKQRSVPARCPACQSERIRHYGTGTQRVESEVQTLFPHARILRWDSETTRQKGAHDLILNQFTNHQADILVGTQMLAKGLDLPLVTLVGVVLADVGLTLPDYRASERTFQVLTQVAGRAGRSPLGGQVILQTFQPDHYVILNAAQHDYESFSRQELEYRRQLGYPPFVELARLEYRHSDAQRAESTANRMAQQLRAWIKAENRQATDVSAPLPCFFALSGGQYRWQILMRGPDLLNLLRGRSLADWRVELDPPSLL